MPMYEFKCTDCGTQFEELVPRTSNATLPCPNCSSAKTQKLMSRLGGISMGSGGAAACPSASACAASGGGCCGGSCPMS